MAVGRPFPVWRILRVGNSAQAGRPSVSSARCPDAAQGSTLEMGDAPVAGSRVRHCPQLCTGCCSASRLGRSGRGADANSMVCYFARHGSVVTQRHIGHKAARHRQLMYEARGARAAVPVENSKRNIRSGVRANGGPVTFFFGIWRDYSFPDCHLERKKESERLNDRLLWGTRIAYLSVRVGAVSARRHAA